MKIFLDDERRAWPGFQLVKNYDQFVKFVTKYHNEITDISLDHDLGLMSKDGYECAKWLCDYMLDGNTFPKLESLTSHSANPAGVENILGLFKSMYATEIITANVYIGYIKYTYNR